MRRTGTGRRVIRSVLTEEKDAATNGARVCRANNCVVLWASTRIPFVSCSCGRVFIKMGVETRVMSVGKSKSRWTIEKHACG